MTGPIADPWMMLAEIPISPDVAPAYFVQWQCQEKKSTIQLYASSAEWASGITQHVVQYQMFYWNLGRWLLHMDYWITDGWLNVRCLWVPLCANRAKRILVAKVQWIIRRPDCRIQEVSDDDMLECSAEDGCDWYWAIIRVLDGMMNEAHGSATMLYFTSLYLLH